LQKLVKLDILLCQGVISAHDANILSVVEPMVLKGKCFTGLAFAGSVCQHRRKVTQRKIGDAFIEHVGSRGREGEPELKHWGHGASKLLSQAAR
jgi:hypothetical protein